MDEIVMAVCGMFRRAGLIVESEDTSIRINKTGNRHDVILMILDDVVEVYTPTTDDTIFKTTIVKLADPDSLDSLLKLVKEGFIEGEVRA